MSVTWVAYLAGFIFYVWPERYGRQAPVFLVHLVSVILIPVFIYYGARGIRSVGQRIVSRHDRKIVKLRKDLKDRLDELKKKTAFDSTKNLIDRYSAGGGAKPDEGVVQKPGPQPNALSKLKQQQQILDEKNRRRTMPNFGTAGTRTATSAPVGSAPTSPDPVSGLNPKGAPAQLPRNPGQLPGAQQQQQPPPHFALPETGVVKVTQSSGQAQAKSTAAATDSRPWLDKLVDQLVGDTSGVDEKYALICRHCYAHNGLVLVDEINDIQYTCPKCGKFNPSNRAIRAAAAAPAAQPLDYQSSRTVEHSDQGESGIISSRGDNDFQNARSTAVDGDDGDDSAAEFDVSKVNTRPRRSGRAVRDTSAQPVSAVTSDTEGHDLKPQQPEQPPQTGHPTDTVPQQKQKLTPKKRKGNKAKRSL
ncbi:hypothetical protein H4S04_000496 [Coemansia sp. S16]|nr:hypothetical protein H4S04_000496 [Coemansia sp. S16]